VAEVERAVIDRYGRISIPERHRKTLATLAEKVSTDSATMTANLCQQLTKQLEEFDRQEDRFLDLIGSAAVLG
jgi:hypothetical protein